MNAKPWDGLPKNPNENGRHKVMFLGSPLVVDWDARHQWYKRADTGMVFSPLEISRMRFSHYIGPVAICDGVKGAQG